MISAISLINFKIAQFRTGVLFETHWDCYEHCCKLSTAIKVQKKLGLGFGNTFHVRETLDAYHLPVEPIN